MAYKLTNSMMHARFRNCPATKHSKYPLHIQDDKYSHNAIAADVGNCICGDFD